MNAPFMTGVSLFHFKLYTIGLDYYKQIRKMKKIRYVSKPILWYTKFLSIINISSRNLISEFVGGSMVIGLYYQDMHYINIHGTIPN